MVQTVPSLSRYELADAFKEILNTTGHYLELGVFQGDTFKPATALARSQDRVAIAVDSFQGMAEPETPEEQKHYPAGRLAFSLDNFKKALSAYGLAPEWYCIYAGFIPDILAEITSPTPGTDLEIALAFVDLDHYRPTRKALDWLWPQIVPGGLLIVDDHFLDRRHGLASQAIDEWLKTPPAGLIRLEHFPNSHTWIRKCSNQP